MWELIENNRRRSLWLFFALFLVLAVLGGLIGASLIEPYGAWWGVGIAVAFSLILAAVAYWAGDEIVMSVGCATRINKESSPQLYNIVEEMQIAAGFGRMPEIYIVADDAMNAFATGIRPEKSAIAVTAGLVEHLSRDELQGVVAHEMSHIVNRDVLFMTFSGVLLGSITMLSEGFLRGFVYTGGGSRRSKLGSSSRSHPAIMIAALVFALLAPLLARIFYFAVSRKREYLADATAVRLTRYPEGLASALEKLAAGSMSLEHYNRFTAPLFIVDPQEREADGVRRAALFSAGSTHPPVHERIQILRKLSGAGFRDYQSAFMKVKKEAELIPERMLRDKTAVPLRPPSADATPVGSGAERTAERMERFRDVGNILMATGGFLFLPCECGLRIKVPSSLGKTSIPCPRCGRILILPSVTTGVTHQGAETKKKEPDAGEPPLVYERKSDGWESFSCRCGYPIHLSPLFRSTAVTCRNCGRSIEIR